MPICQYEYDPARLPLADRLAWVSATDGDTPTVQMPVRMLGIDAPEYHYLGASKDKPGKYDTQMESFLSEAGKGLDPGLKRYLKKRLTAKPCTRQIRAGEAAFEHFKAMVQRRLDRGAGRNGKARVPRKLFVTVAREVFDKNGRLLAYVNASYTKAEWDSMPMSERPTFNLQMMQEGHAVSLMIFPNVPKPADLELVQAAGRAARTGRLGLWADKDRTLLPYEFRWIVDTIRGKRNGPDRYCADISNGRLYDKQGYYRVLPENRLFFLEKDRGDAEKMGFKMVA